MVLHSRVGKRNACAVDDKLDLIFCQAIGLVPTRSGITLSPSELPRGSDELGSIVTVEEFDLFRRANKVLKAFHSVLGRL
jgi:hypothetical protein